MGSRGPKPTPTATLKLRGSWRAKTRKGEPKPASVVPACPDGLDSVAKAEWKRIVGLLERNGLITELDRTALEGYCVHYALWRKYLAALQKQTVGTTTHRRVAACASDAYASMMRSAALFGMSPADRARVSVEPADKDVDPIDRFLTHGNEGA